MEKVGIIIEQVDAFSTEVADAIKQLAPKIGQNYKQLTDQDILEMIESQNTFILLARESATGKIVGMITVLIFRIPYVRKADVENLVVDENYRGQGIGTKLMEAVLTLAKDKGASYADLTARPRRAESNELYKKLGFSLRETNVYRKVFDYKEV